MQRGLCYALGRRLSKTFDGTITRWVYDRNTPLHEWAYNEQDKPQAIVDDMGQLHVDKAEPTENIITWVFEEGSFKPAAKLVNNKQYSIICDYLGTPVEMYDEFGAKTWECELDIYGKVRTIKGNNSDCPFRYQGQYEDVETGLYYNRFRYYSAEEGLYLSQDPIGLAGNNPTLYAYTEDVNYWIDPFGLNHTPGSALLKHVVNAISIGRNTIELKGISNYTTIMEAGKLFVGKNPEIVKDARGNIIEMVSKDGLKRFRAPKYKVRRGYIQANFEMRTDLTDWKNANKTNVHVRCK